VCFGAASLFIMVKLPERNDPTLEAMYEAMQARAQQEKERDYLGASLIGNPCARQIWYSYNGYDREPFEALTLMRFEDGHRTEDLTAEGLRMVAGIELWTHDEYGNQFGFSYLNGKFKGHCDGVILGLKQAPKTPHVWECKACEDKKFNEFVKAKQKHGEKNALREWNENYYAQAQLYMHFLQLDRHYLTVARAGGRGYDSCRTEYNAGEAARYIDRADKIINATEPPQKINENADFYICNWCDFKEVCHEKTETKKWP
jgi:hypothetical protein